MNSDASVTQWINRVKAERDEEAAQRLYQRYMERLVNVARHKLLPGQRRDSDEEDIAIAAMNSLFQGIADGRFPQLADRGDLWQVLLMLVERRAVDRCRRQSADKRGGGVVNGESALMHVDDVGSHLGGIDHVPGPEPTPDLAAELKEEVERRLKQLPEPELRQIALWKMESRPNEEIAQLLGCVPRTVERRLQLIRTIWESSGHV